MIPLLSTEVSDHVFSVEWASSIDCN